MYLGLHFTYETQITNACILHEPKISIYNLHSKIEKATTARNETNIHEYFEWVHKTYIEQHMIRSYLLFYGSHSATHQQHNCMHTTNSYYTDGKVWYEEIIMMTEQKRSAWESL